MKKIIEQNTNVRISIEATIWVFCTIVIILTYLAKIDLGIIEIFCWFVFIGGIFLCVVRFVLNNF